MSDELIEEKVFFLRALNERLWRVTGDIACKELYFKDDNGFSPNYSLSRLWAFIYCYQKTVCPDEKCEANKLIKNYFDENMVSDYDKDTELYYDIIKKMWDKENVNFLNFQNGNALKDPLNFLLEEAKDLIRESIDEKLNDSEEFPDYSAIYLFNLIICWQRIKHRSKWKDGQALVKDYFK